jgi:hypothetical protein
MQAGLILWSMRSLPDVTERWSTGLASITGRAHRIWLNRGRNFKPVHLQSLQWMQ